MTAFGPARDVRPKIVLCSQGDPVESLYLIQAGAVKLIRDGFRARRILVDIRSSGWLLGTAPLEAGEPWHVTAEVMQPACIRRLSVHAYRDQMDNDRRFRSAVFRMMAVDLLDRVKRTSLSLEDLGDRLARALTDLVDVGEPRTEGILLPSLTHEELAQAVPCGRVAVTRELSRFETAGLISRAGRRIFIPFSSRLLSGPA